MSSRSSREPSIQFLEHPGPWGRVLICGGTNWQTNGRKNRKAEEPTDLLAPHILRSLSNLEIVEIIAGCAADFFVALDRWGTAHLFGNVPGLARGSISHEEPLHISPILNGHVPYEWIEAACGYRTLFLLNSRCDVWAAGQNTTGQLGYPVLEEQTQLVKISGDWERDGGTLLDIRAGVLSTIFRTDRGAVYACGSSEHGLLGNGTTGQRLVKGNKEAFDMQSRPKRVRGLDDKFVRHISSGNYHCMALTNDGQIYAWGMGDHGALGLGSRSDALVPTLVPEFDGSEPRKTAKRVICGPSSSVAIDGEGTMHVTGTWKLAGDGGHGKPFLSFRRLQGDQADILSIGGAGYFIRTETPSDENDTIYSWGEGALYGELGYGVPQSTSSHNPTPIKALRGMEVISIAAGLWSTLFLVQPNAALAELDRWPLEVQSAELCLVCNKHLEDSPALECERCDEPYHPACLDPPLQEWPEGQWFCPECVSESEQRFWEYVVHEEDEPKPPRKKRTRKKSGAKAGIEIKVEV